LAASRAKILTGHVVLPVPLLLPLDVVLLLVEFDVEFGDVVGLCSILPIENKLF
jgi:hypothetical protein